MGTGSGTSKSGRLNQDHFNPNRFHQMTTGENAMTVELKQSLKSLKAQLIHLGECL